jgi:hypothetical protein
MKIQIIGMSDDGEKQIVYGYYYLQGGKVVSAPQPGHELSMSRLLEHDNYVENGRRRVSAVASPQEWLKACPENFDGMHVRARMV